MNFIARIHSENNIETNTVLGEQYKVIRKDCNEKEFDTEFKRYFGIAHTDEILKGLTQYKNAFAYITFDSGQQSLLLEHTDNVYIMTESGQTFSKLTQKFR